jgi:formylglycine-generating enzyme required for sulfatase activity
MWHVLGVKSVQRVIGSLLVVGACPAVHADIDPLSGIDFVTVGNVGNAPWAGDGTPGDRAVGRGQVNYEYKIGRFEVNTAQWVEFMNAVYDRPVGDAIPHAQITGLWGAASTTPVNTSNPAARRWTTPAGSEMRAVGGISWRTAAIYANWLCNGKALNREAFLNGAYDVSTFGFQTIPFGQRFTDQFAHTPGAAYYIPTWDEWLKAAHYDPQKQNSEGSVGGWWNYSNASDQPWVGGPPGSIVNGQLATANFGFGGSGQPNPFIIPLGAYPGTSPWGLFDIAGGTSEWTEEVVEDAIFGFRSRGYDGSQWNSSPGYSIADRINSNGGTNYPQDPDFHIGLRIAMTVPTPSTLALLGAGLWPASRRRRNGGSSCVVASLAGWHNLRR